MKKIITLFLIFISANIFAQHTQTIEGSVFDKETKTAIIGAAILMTDDTTHQNGTLTNADGNFELQNIVVGKHDFQINAIGYYPVTLMNVLVTSGKEVVLNVELDKSVHQLKSIKITTDKKNAQNEMAMTSARTFDVQETERYAGSRQDPARMASNFAGVSGTDDSRNDIVVRGNSPLGVVWRLEDIDIFNPNHFNIPGSTGGPVSIINNKTLANSDFFTGAFPAEYGNGTAGVFDLKLKNGNTDKYEGSAQFGVMGAELSAEGPFSKKTKSSFQFAYRYATLDWLNSLHIPIGTNSIPKYQDATFKLNFPINKKSKITVFGIGGLSNIDLVVSKFSKPPTETYGEDDRDQYFKTNMAVLGVGYFYRLSNSAYTKITVAKQWQAIDAHQTRVYRDVNFKIDSMKPILGYNYFSGKNCLNWFLNKQFNVQHTLKFGIEAEQILFNFIDSTRELPVGTQVWHKRWNSNGAAFLLQPFIQYKFKITDSLIFTAGIHGQIFTLNNNSKSIEPRIGLKKIMKCNQSIGFAMGLHSQLQPLYTYFYAPNGNTYNKNMGFTKSIHAVLSYDKSLNKYLRIKIETYYQYLFNAPIENRSGSSFSLLNMGSSFERFFPDTLLNKGVGRNYGIELTLEKLFNKHFYYLLTASLFDSKYKGNDAVFRNTDFNGNYVLNILGGYEKNISKNTTVNVGGKITYGGGKRYSAYDSTRSKQQQDIVVVDNLRNQFQFKSYFRTDLKIGVRINVKHFTHEIAIDLVNILNTKNILGYSYEADLQAQGKNPFVLQYQLGLLPLFYYKVDF